MIELNCNLDNENNYNSDHKYKNCCIAMTIITTILLVTSIIFLALFVNAIRQKDVRIKIDPPQFVTSSTASLIANWNNKNKIYKYYFYYGTTSNRYSYSTSETYVSSPNMSSLITNLKPDTIYYYQAVIEPTKNNPTNGISSWANFTTIRSPILNILPPANMTNTSAVLHGTITNFGSSYLYYKFGYKLTLMDRYIYTQPINLPSNGKTYIYYKLDGLSKDYYYDYRIVANEQYHDDNAYNEYLSRDCYFMLGRENNC